MELKMVEKYDEVYTNILYNLKNGKGENTEMTDFFRFAVDNYTNSFSQCFQDLWVIWETYYKSTSSHSMIHNGFFVEFGAWDGVHDSNTHLLQWKYGWEGILAEPSPDVHDHLFKHRDNGKVNISKKAVTDKSGKTVDFFVSDVGNLSSLDSIKTRDYNAEKRTENGRTVKVETITLYDMLVENLAHTNIDYISVDTEGNEVEILTKFFEQNNESWRSVPPYQVKMFSIEHNYNRDIMGKLDVLMRSNGYEQMFPKLSQWDSFWRKAE